MTINERTALLPKEYQKTYIIPMPQDDENNNVSNDNNNNNNNTTEDNGVLQEYDSYALTKDELNKYIDDPWWIKMRYGCFSLCWIVCLIALAISLCIAADALRNDHCGGVPLANNATIQTTPAPIAVDGPLSSPVDPTLNTPISVVFAVLTQQAT